MLLDILISSSVIPAKAGTHGWAVLDRKNLRADGWVPAFAGMTKMEKARTGKHNMRTTYDSEANALYVRLSDGAIVESEELRPGLFIDFDKDGRIVGFEMLNARMQLPADALASVAAA